MTITYRHNLAADLRRDIAAGSLRPALAAEVGLAAAVDKLTDYEAGELYASCVRAASAWVEDMYERYLRRKCSAERITAQYGNRLGVRVLGGPADHDPLIEVAAAREAADAAMAERREIIADMRRLMARAGLDYRKTEVIAGRYFTSEPRPYRRFVASGISKSHNTARAIERDALEKIGKTLRGVSANGS